MSVESFMAEFNSHPRWVKNYRVIGDLGYLDLDHIGDRVYLNGLMVPASERGRGQGTKLLKFVLDMADRHHAALHGFVQSYGSDPSRLGQRELRAWYKRHGFRVTRNGCIVRPVTNNYN